MNADEAGAQETMVSDQEIATGVEMVLRESDPNAVTSLHCVVQQLEAKLGMDLSHKANFIRDQITFLLRSHPVPKDQLPPLPPSLYNPTALFSQQFHHSHFTLQQQHQLLPLRVHDQTDSAYYLPPPPSKQENTAEKSLDTPKGRAPTGAKRRGGPGGLNKVCGVSPMLQVIVGEPALPRTEIVRQLWAYIRKHNLQDPGNKKKIICDDALRLVFETDSTDMFKMNKLLAKHILPLDPTKQSDQAKKVKVEDDPKNQSLDSGVFPVIISDELAKFFETEEREMFQSDVVGRVWEYIKVNRLEDPLSSMVIHCDAKLRELVGCESIFASGVEEMLGRHYLSKR